MTNIEFMFFLEEKLRKAREAKMHFIMKSKPYSVAIMDKNIKLLIQQLEPVYKEVMKL